MNPSSVFLRIKDYILVEFIYSQEQKSGAFIKYVNNSTNEPYLVNSYDMKNVTNNVETFLSVNSGNGYMAVIDINEGFYYPNSNHNISAVNYPTGINLKYDTIKFHIRSGYNFQDTDGFYINLYLKTLQNTKVSLLSQVVFKGDISQFRYNNTPIRISEATFDKYVEYKVLSVAEIIQPPNQTSNYFNAIFNNINKNPLIYLDFSFINNVDSSEGFVKFYLGTEDVVYIPAYDGFDRLEANLVEKSSFFEYSAQWDGQYIENFITILNSKAGNNYYIEHEIAVYEQRGLDFYEVQRHNSVQKFNYDIPMKFRPIVTNNVDGSIQVEYIMKFFNESDNTSVVKRAFLNTMNVNPYLEEPIRINVPINNVHKLYNKVVRKDISIDNKKSLFDNKIIVPIYYSNVAMKIESANDFILEIVPFDNVYSIYINQEFNGQDIPVQLDPAVKYNMVFITTSGEKVRISENDVNGKLNGVLNFKISSEQANIILRDSKGDFYINSVSDSIETNLLVSSWEKKGKKSIGIVDSLITNDMIIETQTPVVIEQVSTDIPVVEVPVTNENIETLESSNSVEITKNVVQKFDLQDVPKDTLINVIDNPVIGNIQQVQIIPDNTTIPVRTVVHDFDRSNLSFNKIADRMTVQTIMRNLLNLRK